MANIFQPVLNQTATPTYINPGVQDNSTASLIGNMGNLLPGAVGAYKEYKTSQIMPEIDEAITTYEQGREAGITAGVQGPAIAQMKEEAWGPVPKLADKIGYTTQAYEQNMAKVAKAKEQGLITESELLGRINQITRTAVMKNPWLENELYAKAQGYLQKSGISDVLAARMKTAEAGADANQKRYEFYRKELSDEGETPFPNEPEESLVRRLDAIRQVKQKASISEAARKGQVVLSAQQLDDVLKSGVLPEYTGAEMSLFIKSFVSDMKGAQTGEQYAAVLGKYRLEAEDRKRGFKDMFVTAFGASPDARVVYTELGEEYDRVLEGLEKFSSGADAATYMKNRFTIIEAAQEVGVRETHDVAKLKLFAMMAGAFEKSEINMLSELGKPAIIQLMKDALNLLDSSNAGGKAVDKAVFGGGGAKLFGVLSAKVNPTSVDVQATEEVVKAFNERFKKPMTGMQELQAAVSANQILADVARAGAGFSTATSQSPTYSREVTEVANYAMEKAIPVLDTLIQDALNKRPDLQISFDISPAGTWVVESNDPNIARKFNEKFGPQINNALDAVAKSSGKSREQVGADFFQKHFQQYLPVAPQGGTDPVGLPTSDLKPEGVPLPTPEVIEGPTELQQAPMEVQPAPPPPVDEMEEITKISNMYNIAKDLYKKKKISKEEYDMRIDILNKKRKDIYPDSRLFPYEEEAPDKKSSVDNEGMIKYLDNVLAELNKPRSVLRDENGRITGVA